LSRWKHSLAYALVLTLTAALLAVLFRVPQTLRKADAFKTIRIENISQGTVYLGYINQIYQTLPLADFARDGWALGPVPDSDLQALTSARAEGPLEVQIPIAGSTQFVFITAPESGRVRVTDLETGRVSELDLRQPAHYTVTLSTVSGTKRAWDFFLVSLLFFVTLSTLTACLLKGWRNGLRIWSDAAYTPLASVIIGLTIFLNNLFMAQRLFFYGDSKNYWELAPTFLKDGVFALGNLEMLYSFRGYVLPLLTFLARGAGRVLGLEGVLVFVLMLAAIYTAFFVWTVPRILCWLTGREARPYEILAIFALTGFFWLGWFTWLLSDLLAMCALLTGLTLLLDGIQSRRWLNLLLGGLFMGVAINCRPNYIVGLVASFALILYYLLKERSTLSLVALSRKAVLIASLYLLGVVLVSLPQAQINWQQFHKASLFPFASSNPNSYGLETHGTFLEYSLAYGRLRTQGWPYPYPNHFGISSLYRYFGLDPVKLHDYVAAGEMLKQHGGMNLGLYLRLTFRYPLESVLNLFLTTFAGLNNQSFEPYPVNWHAGLPVAWFSFFNYCVLFLAALLGYYRLSDLVRHKQANWPISLWLLTLALPALAYVPMFVEWRYFLPIYFSLYLLLVATDRSTYARIFSNKLWLLQFILFLLICYSFSTLVTPVFLD